MSLFSQNRSQFPAAALVVKRIREDLQFSRIFLCDVFAAAAHVVATIYLLRAIRLPRGALLDMALLASLYVALHLLKISLVIFLERKGGDAREFIGSERIVTEGVYRYSRNPVYLISIAQSVVWSILLLRGASAETMEPFVIAAAIFIPIGHFISIDRLVIPNEETALRQAHPEAFAGYARRVNRWLGWRRTDNPPHAVDGVPPVAKSS